MTQLITYVHAAIRGHDAAGRVCRCKRHAWNEGVGRSLSGFNILVGQPSGELLTNRRETGSSDSFSQRRAQKRALRTLALETALQDRTSTRELF